MQRILSIFQTIIITFVLVSAIAAQASGVRVQITVNDANGMPVPGAEVTFTAAGHPIRSVRTDPQGLAVAEGLTEMTYGVTVRAKGFATVLREISIANGTTSIEQEIELPVAEIAETVNVTAERRQVTGDDTATPVTVVGSELIERRQVNTPADIFRTLPGTSTANEGSFQVRPRIRGLESNRILVLIDGERLNNSRTSTEQSGVELGLIDISQIDAVEVVRGSGSVLYGTDAMGGTINIITRDTPARRAEGFRFGGTLDGYFTSNGKGRRGSASVNGAGRHFAFRLGQSLERTGNYFTGEPKGNFLEVLRSNSATISDEGEVMNSQSHAGNTSGAVRLFFNDENTAKVSFERRRGADIGSAGLLDTFNAFFPFSNRDKISGRYDSAILGKYLQRVSASAFYQTQKRDFTNILTVSPVPPFFPGLYRISETVTDTRTSGFDLQSDWTFGGRNSLIAGLSFFRDSNTDVRTITTRSTPSSPTATVNTSKSVPNATLANIGVFAQNEFRVTDRFKLTGGFRYDRFRTTSDPTTGFTLPNLRQDQIDDLGVAGLASGLAVTNRAVTGDLGAVFKLTRNVSVSGRVGRSFRTPNIFELFFTDSGSAEGFIVGNPNLKPETGVNFDTSVKATYSKFAASFTYFHNRYRNLLTTEPADDSRGCPVFIVRSGTVYDANNCFIISSPPGPAPVRVYQTVNIARAKIQGFEAELEAPIKISVGYLTPYGNVSYLRGDDTGSNEPLNFISPWRGNIGLRWNNYRKSYYFDYLMRAVVTQDRLSETFIFTPVDEGGNGGAEAGFVTHNLTGGYYFRRERYDVSVNLGVSNIFDRAYSEQFTFAPARGRSFTIGTSLTFK